jgi:Ca-activated chloride channel homolog
MKFAALFCSIPILWPLWASAAPPPAAPAHGQVQVQAQPLAPQSAPAKSGAGQPARTPFAPSDAHAGALVLYDAQDDGDGGWLAPQVSNHVAIDVTGLIARARVQQSFENESEEVVHAVYVFPLPETAAVDGLTLLVGKRRIVGEIREREAALRRFEAAKRQGKKASLVEQQRPNLFTTHVANIAPHEIVTVELSYQQDVRYDSGTFSLEFPATLTPRYLPGPSGGETRRARAPHDAGAQSHLRPPFALAGAGPTLELELNLDAGVPLQRITSPSHRLTLTQPAVAGAVKVELQDGEVLADRDFRLEWAPAPSRAPSSAVFEEEFGGDRYALLLLLPPDPALHVQQRMARETTFIIDTSGSMSGTSIEQARAALESGLAELLPADRFNVVEFNSDATRLFDESVPATPDNVQRALRWVRKLQADGGTEMLAALDLALAAPAPPGYLSQVVFVTDGSVGNESEVFAFLQGHLAERRLFTVGIGSAPNQYFMRGAARFGRGTFTAIASEAEVGSRMNELWAKLDTPLMTELALAFVGDASAETWPARAPDLYAGEPLVVVAKLGARARSVRVNGQRAGQAFTAELPLGASASGVLRERGIHRLWARRKIEALTDRMTLGQTEAELRPQITELALRHHLLSQYTSLVAVDSVRSVEGPGSDQAVANAVPAGNSMFGNLPQTATPAPTCLLVGAASLLAAWVVYRRPRPC